MGIDMPMKKMEKKAVKWSVRFQAHPGLRQASSSSFKVEDSRIHLIWSKAICDAPGSLRRYRRMMYARLLIPTKRMRHTMVTFQEGR